MPKPRHPATLHSLIFDRPLSFARDPITGGGYDSGLNRNCKKVKKRIARKQDPARTKLRIILVELLPAQSLFDLNPKQGKDSRPELLPDVRQK